MESYGTSIKLWPTEKTKNFGICWPVSGWEEGDEIFASLEEAEKFRKDLANDAYQDYLRNLDTWTNEDDKGTDENGNAFTLEDHIESFEIIDVDAWKKEGDEWK